MSFTPDAAVSLQAAASLVNTAGPPDTLLEITDLEAFYATFEFTGRHDRDATELAQVRELRPRLRALLTAPRDAAVTLLNDLLAEAGAVPQLVRHDRFDWHVHAVSPDAPVATRIAVETAMAMLDAVRADEMSRLSVCADADCDGVVVDLSRNRSRRFCSTTCGNRNAAAAYRARRARSDPS